MGFSGQQALALLVRRGQDWHLHPLGSLFRAVLWLRMVLDELARYSVKIFGMLCSNNAIAHDYHNIKEHFETFERLKLIRN